MEILTNYLKKNIKLAYKSVLFHFKQYLCFYVALFIIQFLFGIIMMSTVSSNHLRKVEVEEKYDYHVCLVGITYPQYAAIRYNNEVVRSEDRVSDGNTVYDVYCYFDGNCEEGYATFSDDYLQTIQGEKFGNIIINTSFSPLYELQSETENNNLVCILLLIALLLVGILILLLLYNIRINHFKFTYGIYMSYGADFRKLFETSVWEMLMIGTITLIPAAIAATVTDWLFFVVSGFSYYFSPWCMLLALPFASIATFFAVYIPIKRSAVKPPLELLLAEDNSNLVISPRLSFNMTNRKFPTSYNFFSAIRFRKYNIQIVLSSVIFAVLFIFSVFGSSVYSYYLNMESPEYVVSFNQQTVTWTETNTYEVDVTQEAVLVYNKHGATSEEYLAYQDTSKYRIEGDPAKIMQDKCTIYEIVSEEVEVTGKVGDTFDSAKAEELLAIPGVTGLYKSCSYRAYNLTSHVALPSQYVKDSADMLSIDGTSYTQNAIYYATDDDIVNYLMTNYEYTGDPTMILNNEDQDKHYVIVTNSVNNIDTMTLQPGDYVTIGTLVEMYGSTDEPITGNEFMKFLIENGEYDYTKFVVCAVIDNITTASNYPLFISEADYHLVTGLYPIYTNVSVYVDQSLDSDQLDVLTENLRTWSEKYTYTSVTLKNALEDKHATLSQCRYPLLLAVALTILAVSPLFWFFSQIMFYGKRDKEFDLLRGMGATESEIRGLFVRDGAFYACFGCLVVLIFGAIGVYGIHRLALFLLSGGSTFRVKYLFEVPWFGFSVGLLVTALCGFLSSMIPYSVNKKRVEMKMSMKFDDE